MPRSPQRRYHHPLDSANRDVRRYTPPSPAIDETAPHRLSRVNAPFLSVTSAPLSPSKEKKK